MWRLYIELLKNIGYEKNSLSYRSGQESKTGVHRVEKALVSVKIHFLLFYCVAVASVLSFN